MWLCDGWACYVMVDYTAIVGDIMFFLIIIMSLLCILLCHYYTYIYIYILYVMLFNMLLYCYRWRYFFIEHGHMLLWPWYYVNVEHVMLLWPWYYVNVEHISRLINTLFQCDHLMCYYNVMVEHVFLTLLMFRLSVFICCNLVRNKWEFKPSFVALICYCWSP